MGSYAILSEKIFIAFKIGNEKSFKVIYQMYNPIIRSYVLKFSNSLEDTEEIVHDAFVSLYLNRQQIATASGLYPYLFTIAKRLTINNFRKKVIEKKYQDHLRIVWEETVDNTQELLSSNELQQAINKVVCELPAKQREVYMLNKQHELSYLEISNLLGISINTVRNHLVVAVKQIKLRLTEFNLMIYFVFIFF